MRLLAALLALLALFPAGPALAWGRFGHHVVADVAMANVRPQTAARIRALLRDDRGLGTPECRVQSLRDAAYWPDCIRREGWRWGHTAPWHYQAGPLCKPLPERIDCPNGNCVSAQIRRNHRLFADRTLPAAQRLEALAFLTHFVGDIHQPLHAADKDGDAGGNAVAARYGIAPGRNLHAIWDGPLAERAITSAAPRLVRRYADAERAELAGGEVAEWGEESWRLSHELVYPRALDRDPCTGPSPRTIVWSDEDIEASIPALQRRIAQAGLRLARLLDEALAPS
jgi:hypothetical protein